MVVSPRYRPILQRLGLDAESVFTCPDIRVWRSLPERENATLDATLPDGQRLRLHIKRYRASAGAGSFFGAGPAAREARGIALLESRDIPTVPLVAWGQHADGRGFIITEDLAGFEAADKLVERGLGFDRLRDAVADLAARLHSAGLHHRDLYLCHFFAKVDEQGVALRLIDAGRVKRLPRWPMRRRWIVKDLAQLWYSTLALSVTDAQRMALLERYAQQRGTGASSLVRAIERKVRRIARHDANLRRNQPTRNISIPRPANSEP